jgi:hypothetical protein
MNVWTNSGFVGSRLSTPLWNQACLVPALLVGVPTVPVSDKMLSHYRGAGRFLNLLRVVPVGRRTSPGGAHVPPNSRTETIILQHFVPAAGCHSPFLPFFHPASVLAALHSPARLIPITTNQATTHQFLQHCESSSVWRRNIW